MEEISENDNSNSNINISKIINNQNDSNQQITDNSNPKESPFQLITKDQERREIKYINNKDKYENDNIDTDKEKEKNKDKDKEKSKDEIRSEGKRQSTIKSNDKENIRLIDERKNSSKKSTIITIQRHTPNQQKPKNKNHKCNLDNLSPEVYMRKKMEYTEKNINPLEIKIKRIEQAIQRQFDYDYKRVMEQMKYKLDLLKKNKEQQKHILKEEQKLKEKLKSMEEYRENVIKERAEKVFKKQKRSDKSMKKNKTVQRGVINENDEYRSFNNSKTSSPAKNSRKYCQTIESNDSTKLPVIHSRHEKYKIIKEKKDLNEKEFIQSTEENIKSLEFEHEENLKYHQKVVTGKIKELIAKYNQRKEMYSKYRIEKQLEKNEQILQKNIIRSYNIKLNLLRDRSEKSGKLKEHIKKKLENYNEKKEQLEENEKKRIKEYLKKINRYNRNSSNNSVSNKMKRQKYSNKQKANINNAEKEFERKYNDFLTKQENLINLASDMQHMDNYKRKNLYHINLRKQNENEEKYQSFSLFLEKMEKNNIINKPDDFKLKLYNKKVREELEEKRRKEEELLK